MKKFIYLIFIQLLFANSPINNYEYQKLLGIGINVNWVNFKKEIRNYSDKIPCDFKQIGFKSVRIRFDFANCKKFHISKTEYTNLIKKVVNDSLKNNLTVVLANGAHDFKLNPNETTKQQLINDWLIIANTFKNYSYKLSYNFIIEPGKNLSKHHCKNNPILNSFYKELYFKIRAIDKKRILIWAPNRLSNPFNLEKTWYPKNDNYIIAEWHMYAAGPKPDYKIMIPKKVNFAYNWSIKHHIPTWVGAWMPGNYNHGNNYSIKEQINFSIFMIKNLKKHHIPFAINADQQFYNINTKSWRENRSIVLKNLLNAFYQ